MKKSIALLLVIFIGLSCSTNNDSNGNSTTTVVPIAPTNLIGTAVSATQIDLSWTDNSTNETGFKIERRTGTGNYVLVGTVNADILTYSDTGLSPIIAYTYRVYSFNTVGSSPTYSNEISLSPNAAMALPTLTTTVPTSFSYNGPWAGGIISNDGGYPIQEIGVVWSTNPNPTINLPTKINFGSTPNNDGSFGGRISGIIPNTVYYLRAYAKNIIGTGYGNQQSFTAPVFPPLVNSTFPISSLTTTSASSGGNISTDGGAVVTSRGVVWNTNPNPTIALSTKTLDGQGIGAFSSFITGLTGNTTYYLRAYATNSTGTTYGNEIIFTTPQPTTVTDIDGNVYQTVAICNQRWTKTNLNVSKYRNGDVIPQVSSAAQLASLTTGAWCYFNNYLPYYEQEIGRAKLYNWYAVNDPRGLAPVGYHIPSDSEWTTLTNCLGGEFTAGGKMKGLYFDSPNTGATNSSGFNAVSNGVWWRSTQSFEFISQYGVFWSSTTDTTLPASAFNRRLSYNDQSCSNETGFHSKQNAMSVRCVKD